MHHIIYMGIAAHGIFFGEWIVMQPCQIPELQIASTAPVFKLRRFDEFAIGVGSLAHQL